MESDTKTWPDQYQVETIWGLNFGAREPAHKPSSNEGGPQGTNTRFLAVAQKNVNNGFWVVWAVALVCRPRSTLHGQTLEEGLAWMLVKSRCV